MRDTKIAKIGGGLNEVGIAVEDPYLSNLRSVFVNAVSMLANFMTLDSLYL